MLDVLPNTKYPYDLEAHQAWFKQVVADNPTRWIVVGSHAGAITAGIYGHDVCCIYANVSKGNVFYKVHYKGGKWLPEVKNRNDYAGLYNKPIDGFMIKSDVRQLTYRVHLRRSNKWLPWVTGYNQNDSNNGYAGILGQEIDAIQIK